MTLSADLELYMHILPFFALIVRVFFTVEQTEKDRESTSFISIHTLRAYVISVLSHGVKGINDNAFRAENLERNREEQEQIDQSRGKENEEEQK